VFGLVANLKLLGVIPMVIMTALNKNCYRLMRKFWHGLVTWRASQLYRSLAGALRSSNDAGTFVPVCPINLSVCTRSDLSAYNSFLSRANSGIVIQHLEVQVLSCGTFSHFPSTLKSLRIHHCEKELPPLPLSLQSLTYNHIDDGQTLPVGVKTLRKSLRFKKTSCFNHPLPTLPMHLLKLELGSEFNQMIAELPPNLTHLTFGFAFNQPLHSLPAKLELLQFAFAFNFPLPTLPPSLTHLKFGTCFDQPLTCLPCNLKSLEFGSNFDQPLPSLPSSLTCLRLGFCFNRPLFALPPKLEFLELGRFFQHPLPSMPSSLHTLKLHPTSHLTQQTSS
jgi:hypothetical protein